MQDSVVTHDEADVTLYSYMLKPVAEGAQTIRILSDDNDVFILLVYWTLRMRVLWNGDVLDINETVQWLGHIKCSELLRIHALLGCDRKKSALKPLEIDMLQWYREITSIFSKFKKSLINSGVSCNPNLNPTPKPTPKN